MSNDDERVERLARLACGADRSLAVAESLTSGRIASRLGSGPDASRWFRGGVVAYAEDVKFDVLGVVPGPVVTEACARQMAVGVRELLQADVSVGVTGVGGPGSEEGHPPGTVHLAVASNRGVRAIEAHLPGEPSEILRAVTTLVLDELLHELDEEHRRSAAPGSTPRGA